MTFGHMNGQAGIYRTLLDKAKGRKMAAEFYVTQMLKNILMKH